MDGGSFQRVNVDPERDSWLTYGEAPVQTMNEQIGPVMDIAPSAFLPMEMLLRRIAALEKALERLYSLHVEADDRIRNGMKYDQGIATVRWWELTQWIKSTGLGTWDEGETIAEKVGATEDDDE